MMPQVDIATSVSNSFIEEATTRITGGKWLWALGAGLIVFAARCREIHLYASDAPFLDQWRVEAQQILVPWLKGQLPWTSFFSPHHEHIPAWTRLLVWLEAALLGRWDPLLQCTINAGLWGATIGLWGYWFRSVLSRLAAIIFTLLAVILAALPFGWENTTWGFQSHIPLALLFVTWHIHGAFSENPLTKQWWVAQLAGLAAFFTLGSMWSAPLAVLVVLLWTSNYDRRRWLPAAVLAVMGLTLLLYARSAQPHVGALAQSVTSLPQFLAAVLVQLGWPSELPAAAALMYAPSILLAWQIRRQKSSTALDRIILAVTLWAAAQAVAFAFARGGAWIGFVSRYGDLLALGVLANAVALWRLIHGLNRGRLPLAMLALAWCYALILGLDGVSTRGHTAYFHQHSAFWALSRGDAVKNYLATKSVDSLSGEEVRGLLYPDPIAVAAVLSVPGLAEMLPVQLRPAAHRTRGDFISAIATQLRGIWPTLGASGAILLILGLILTSKVSPSSIPVIMPAMHGITWRWLAVITAGATVLLSLWPMPFEFNAHKRWEKMLVPPGYLGPLTFQIITPTSYAVDNLTGGANLWPEDFRNVFYGTHIDGPGFTGSARSSIFAINSPWLVIPIAGFPFSAGNHIVLQIEEPDGHIIDEIKCLEPNPTSIGFWQVDVQNHIGKSARLVFIDGRTDGEGWIAAAAPQTAFDQNVSTHLNITWKLEQTSSGHLSLGIISAVLAVATLLMAFRDWRRRVTG